MKPTTPDEQTAALDVLIRAALTNDQAPLTDELRRMLGTLQPAAGNRVANILVMLAGAAVASPDAWVGILNEHIDGARQ
jgi:hypothetical protein